MNEDIHTEYWWTDSFRLRTVLPLWMRILFSPIYGLYTMYLCIKGVPMRVEMKEKYSDEKKDKIKLAEKLLKSIPPNIINKVIVIENIWEYIQWYNNTY